VWLILAGLADLFDGVIARKLALNSFEKEYGVQLDTVVDVVAFVVTPFIIAFHAGMGSAWILCGLAVFVLAGIIRLAHFNTLSVRSANSSTHHHGLPVTYTALFLPLLFIARDFLTPVLFSALLAVSFPLVGLLFVIDIPIRKPYGIFYVLLPLVAVVLIAYWLWRFLGTS
jgi:CDP-diacylglycerol--serine O-phosphatidyltransferase